MESLKSNPLNFQKLYHLLQEEKFTDTILIAGYSKKSVIKCHKLLLIATSPYFEELFNLLDTQTAGPTSIVLRDISHEFLQKILEYIYCGKVDLKANEIFEFKRVANYLKIYVPPEEPEPSQPPKRNVEELDISLTTPMSQDITIDNIIHDFSMNSSITSVFEEEETVIESKKMKETSISLAKVKSHEIEPQLKKPKVETWTYKPEKRPEKCKYCHRMIHEKNPAFHHQRHCFQNGSRVPLKCQQCHADFDFVTNLREHNLKLHRDR